VSGRGLRAGPSHPKGGDADRARPFTPSSSETSLKDVGSDGGDDAAETHSSSSSSGAMAAVAKAEAASAAADDDPWRRRCGARAESLHVKHGLKLEASQLALRCTELDLAVLHGIVAALAAPFRKTFTVGKAIRGIAKVSARQVRPGGARPATHHRVPFLSETQ
jgi:hypothetical protein